jgi:hypothetical protein
MISNGNLKFHVNWIRCHHGMTRFKLHVEVTAPYVNGNCGYVEQAVANSRQGVV